MSEDTNNLGVTNSDEDSLIPQVVDDTPHDVEVINTSLPQNLTVDDILEKCKNEEVLTPDSIPFENVRNNSKIFLIYYAKRQLSRVIKLTQYLEDLEDRLMASSESVSDPEVLMKVIGTIQSSMNTAISLIDKVSTNDNYVKLIYNDNRQVINNLGTINAVGNLNLSKESRSKIRGLAEQLLSQMNNAEGGTGNG